MDVFNAVRRYLAEVGFRTLQLVPPGGQAPYSITYKEEGRRRTCFPDLLAFREGALFVGEMKPRYSRADHAKVSSLVFNASQEIFRLCSRLLGPDAPLAELKGVLCHGQRGAPPVSGLAQWAFSPLGLVAVIPPSEG